MTKHNWHVEFISSGKEIVDIRYYDKFENDRYVSWKIPTNEASDLAKWWKNEGMQVKKNQMPIIGHKYRSICISMFTRAGVDIRGFEQHGGLKLLAYSLPIQVVEQLVIWLQDSRLSQKSNNVKKV